MYHRLNRDAFIFELDSVKIINFLTVVKSRRNAIIVSKEIIKNIGNMLSQAITKPTKSPFL